MSFLSLLAVLVAAGVGSVIGSLLPHVWRRLRDRTRPAEATDAVVLPDDRPLDRNLHRRVQDLSGVWASSRGFPEADFLAAGYLDDAARDLQDRWERLR